MSTDSTILPPPMAPWLNVARAEMARRVVEFVGVEANPHVLKYFTATGLRGTSYALSDETSWCAAFVSWCLEQSGVRSTRSAKARSYLHWGHALVNAEPGCVVVLWRGSPTSEQGHVAFFDGFVGDASVRLLGGNQGNRVRHATYPVGQILGYRWPLAQS